MTPTRLYTLADVVRLLGQREVAKGRQYLRFVSALDIGPERLTARVQGSVSRPYQVIVDVRLDTAGDIHIASRCSCPVGAYCKHAAATLLKAIEERDQADRINPMVLAWIEELRHISGQTPPLQKKPAKPGLGLYYQLTWMPYRPGCKVTMLKARGNPDATAAISGEEWANVERALVQPPAFVTDDDYPILRLLWVQRDRGTSYPYPLSLEGKHGDEILRLLLASGRCLLDGRRLQLGAPRPACLSWMQADGGRTVPQLTATPAVTRVIATDPLWYVDAASLEAGGLEPDMPSALVRHLLAAPPLSAKETPLVAAALAESAPAASSPLGGTAASLKVVDAPLTPVLRLGVIRLRMLYGYRDYDDRWGSLDFDYATPALRYGEIVFAPGDARSYVEHGGEMVRVARDPAAEKRRLKALSDAGLKPLPAHTTPPNFNETSTPLYGLESESAWPVFMQSTVPMLREAGWEIEFLSGFRHDYAEVESWDAEVTQTESGWFDLDMGIVVEGQRLPLAPLLANLFQRDPRWLDAKSLKKIADTENINFTTPQGRRVQVPAERLKPLARTLVDLFDGQPEGSLRVARLDAPRLLGALDNRWRLAGMDAVRELAERLKKMGHVKAVKPPKGFALELRPYQREGLAWLQYLRENELSGILADDMGLGKTAQTLAHLLMEKHAGRLDKPALVVLPTSLIFNWKHEAARFAPALKVLSLHGKARHARFAELAKHDVVLTTYPLLWRDHDELEKHDYHVLILDEAQTVKNAASQAAAVVRRLRARHRLCLTGTPLENHLGELWAQFDFLLPGFLGDTKQFTKTWRTPIEKNGNALRRDLLASRIRPFILRRRKDEVAKELPPKTIILRTVELEAGQRDLYETVRAAMDKKVRDAVADKGFNRSQIVILDALLKLRQVCCDPRLVKSAAAKSVKERAKLQLLMDMLPELVEEGRRILLFSQFTSMLDLIREELDRAKLGYVLLTGDTADRETPIRRFQAGEAPIFLISLKAGGVGLNLTAADTVIHFDPWWNPAVENQATDRAHRLGQTRPVFVYKLIVGGSIEEKILALQDKKAQLAASILSDDHAGEVKFSESDIKALLAPLPAV